VGTPKGMASAPLLVLLVAVSPAIERAVDAVACGVELVRATAARVLEGPALTDEEERASHATDAAAKASRPPRAPRVHIAARLGPAPVQIERALPPPPVAEPGAPRGPPSARP
jgi:hypothetical protein